MSSNSPLSRCDVWQPEDSLPENSFLTKPEFLIEIYARFTSEGNGPSDLHYHSVKVRCDLLTEGRTSWFILSEPLSQISVPYDVQPSAIQTIITRVREISGEPENMNRMTIPIVVDLTVLFAQQQLLDERRSYPTKESAIEELEKAIQGCEKQCAICLDEIEKGCEATRMPCSHVYHGNCIVKWLQKSHLCPLCRFKMPIESS